MNWGDTNHLVQLIPFLTLLMDVLCKDLFWWLEAPVILAFCQACYRQSWMQVILFMKLRDLYNDTSTLWQDKGTSTLLRIFFFFFFGLSLFNCTVPNLLLAVLNASSMRYLSHAQVLTERGQGVTEPPEWLVVSKSHWRQALWSFHDPHFHWFSILNQLVSLLWHPSVSPQQIPITNLHTTFLTRLCWCGRQK